MQPEGTESIALSFFFLSGGERGVSSPKMGRLAQEWDVTPGLTADTLFYKCNYPKTINVNSQVTTPAYSLNCRVRDTNGKSINNYSKLKLFIKIIRSIEVS